MQLFFNLRISGTISLTTLSLFFLLIEHSKVHSRVHFEMYIFVNFKKLNEHIENDECFKVLEHLSSCTFQKIETKAPFTIDSENRNINDILAIWKNKDRKFAPNQCVGCDEVFKTRAELKSHVASSHSTRIWLLDSMRLFSSSDIVCSKCRFSFESKFEYDFHLDSKFCEINVALRKHYFGLVQPNITKISMKPWLKFLSQEDLQSAANIETFKSSKNENKKEIKSENDDGDFPCTDCDKVYDAFGKTSWHIKTAHGIPSWLRYRLRIIPGKYEARCPECLFVLDKPLIRDHYDCSKFKALRHRLFI